jgi:dUTP pyrophosphatase
MGICIKVRNESKNELPEYGSDCAAGCDVRSIEDVDLYPGERVLVKTGLFVEIPDGYEIQVRPRSGLAYKRGLTVLNSPGTIDADYRGEIGVILVNHGSTSIKLDKGERIGQLVLNKVEQIVWKENLELQGTERGEGGFGSTGTK